MNCPRCNHDNPDHALFCLKCGCPLPVREQTPIGNTPGTPIDEVEPLSVGNLPTARRRRRFGVGEVILGRYRVTGELGQGGMGVVYRCHDEVGGIDVALKALPPELSHNSGEMEEVRENFRLVEPLHHPHIAAVKTLERDGATGDYYLILEMAEGVDLRRWRKQKGGKATVGEVRSILRQVAEALDYAHSRKVIHRDVKPSNVMVTGDGRVKVLDFGLAAQIQSSLSRVSQVHYGTSGTGPYMAPEQWRGQRQDGATDQYALAVVAYELLAGRVPFDAPDPTVLQQAILNTAPEPPAGLPGSLWKILDRGLSKGRSERYGSCLELVEAFGGAEDGGRRTEDGGQRTEDGRLRIGGGAVVGTRAPNSQLRAPRSGLRVGVVSVVLVVLVGLAGWYFGLHRPEQKRRAELARVEAEARAASDAKEKARLEAEAERLRTERERQQAADKAKAEAEQRERERLANARGGVTVETVPGGAKVMLGGEDVQDSPASFKQIRLGKYPVRITLEGYEPVSREVEVKENEFTDLGTIRLVRSTGGMKLTSEPTGAEYELTGPDNTRKSGRTPAEVTQLPTGEYRYVVKRGDWEQSGKVTVTRNETAAARVEFGYGSVRVTSDPSGATVVQGSREVGQTPLTLTELRPGAVSYEVKLAKYKPASVSGTVEPKRELALNAKLEKVPYPTLDGPYENSLGMKFVPVTGTEVLFCVWETRVKDYAAADSGADGSWRNPGFSQGEDHPVVNVSWEEARVFCAWLTEKERRAGKIGVSQSYRLPADWEWSVAVGLNESRGGTPKEKDGQIQGVYPWGTQWPPPNGAGNYDDYSSSKISGFRDGFERTSPVGSFTENRYGIYDLGGNVWEWCEDYYDGQSGSRVLRGGSWFLSVSRLLLSSGRVSGTPDLRYYYGLVGFRCVLVCGSAAR